MSIEQAVATLKEVDPKTGQEITTAAGTDLAVVDFGTDAGAGMENVTSDELKVPFLTPLAANSPQVANPPEQGGLPNAKAGMIFNTGTGELYDGKPGLVFIPVHRDHNYVEFTPRNLGGGFVAIHKPDDQLIQDLKAEQGRFGRLSYGVTSRNEKGEALNGTELSETFYLFALIIDPHTNHPFRAVIPFKSTQIKKYQAFMQRQTSFKYANPRSTTENLLPPIQPPIWAHRWRLATNFESNKKGNFYGWSLTLDAKKPDGTEEPYIKSLIRTSDPLYQEAKAFNAMLESGRARADVAGAASEDEEIPF
jgi:hypothetical protein